MLYSFASAFRRMPKSASVMSDVSIVSESNVYRFDIALEFREVDGKGQFVPCPKDKNVFKLRCSLEKKIVITVLPMQHVRDLKIDRFVSHGVDI